MAIKFKDLPPNFFQSLSQKDAVLALGLLLQNPGLRSYLLICGSVISLEVYLVYVLLGEKRREKLIGLAKKFSNFIFRSSSNVLEQPVFIDSLTLDPPISIENLKIDSSMVQNSLKTNATETNTTETNAKKTKKRNPTETTLVENVVELNNRNEPETYDEKVKRFHSNLPSLNIE
jgi:hypothetical protein